MTEIPHTTWNNNMAELPHTTLNNNQSSGICNFSLWYVFFY
jgi:hypothetical protein